MCFPRWHGTDEGGILFADYHARLNSHGLFDLPRDAADFLAFFSSLDWTEGGEYSIVEVHALSDPFYEHLRSPVRYAVIDKSARKELLPAALEGMTWQINLKGLARDHKILGIKALRDITNMGIAEAKAVVEGLPTAVVIIHLGDLKSLKQKLVRGGFDFEIAGHV